MSNFAEVEHHIWIAAPRDTVRSQFGDLDHHIHSNVHPKLSFQKIESGTDVGITIRLPLPALLGWLAPVLKSQVRKEVTAAALVARA